jgi:NADH-quinone oxidoreductase subunit N
LLGATGLYAHSALTGSSTNVWGVLSVGGAFSSVATVVAFVGAAALIGGWSELAERPWGGSLAGLLAFSAAGSVVVAQTHNITLLLISLEAVGACAYALVASGRSAGAREAALKYFIQGAIATALFVIGMAVLVTAFAPTGDLLKLSFALAGVNGTSVAIVAVVPLIAALAFKSGAAPFHSWAPDAYESASPSSAAFLSSGPKLAAITALSILVVLSSTDALVLSLTGVLGVLAVLSIGVGSITALRQAKYTRMLGYAGVAQVGYAIVAVLASRQPQIPLFFMACYALTSTGTFLSAAAFREVHSRWDGTIQDLAGISRKAPWLAVSTSVLLISLAGIPPLLGFWSKFTVFTSAILGTVDLAARGDVASAWIVGIAGVVGIVGSVISLAYYGGVLRALYAVREDAEEGSNPAAEQVARPRFGTAQPVVIALAAIVVIAGLLPLWQGLDVLMLLFR